MSELAVYHAIGFLDRRGGSTLMFDEVEPAANWRQGIPELVREGSEELVPAPIALCQSFPPLPGLRREVFGTSSRPTQTLGKRDWWRRRRASTRARSPHDRQRSPVPLPESHEECHVRRIPKDRGERGWPHSANHIEATTAAK